MAQSTRKSFVSPTTTRVPSHTPEFMNRRIMERTVKNCRKWAADPGRIEERLAKLDREWDIERVLEANASTLVVVGTSLGYLVSPWFYLIPFLVGTFLLQHAIQGWCPPIRLFRRLGFRTHAEIAGEYYTLRALRGDFAALATLDAENHEKKADKTLRIMAWHRQ